MRNLFWLILALALLTVFVAQSYFNYECNLMGTQAADLTVQGVMCWHELDGYRKYRSLEFYREMEIKKQKFEQCMRMHPDNPLRCDPNYIPAGPTPRIL